MSVPGFAALSAVLLLASSASAQLQDRSSISPVPDEPVHLARPQWTRLVAPGFQVEFPARVEVKQVRSEAGGATFTLFTYQTIVQEALYLVSYIDYPAERFKSAVPKDVLDHARDAALAGVKGKLVTEMDVTLRAPGALKPWPGRQLDSVTGDGLRVLARLFLVRNRLYQMIVIFPKSPPNGQNDPKLFERMADSLMLTRH